MTETQQHIALAEFLGYVWCDESEPRTMGTWKHPHGHYIEYLPCDNYDFNIIQQALNKMKNTNANWMNKCQNYELPKFITKDNGNWLICMPAECYREAILRSIGKWKE